LGGVICKNAFATQRQENQLEKQIQNVLRSIRVIFFLGTPHDGGGLAGFAKLLSRSIGASEFRATEIQKIREQSSTVLTQIQDNFDKMVVKQQVHVSSVKISCFYETQVLSGDGVVVAMDSAILSNHAQIPMQSSHMDMTKFQGKEQPDYQLFLEELLRAVREIETPDRGRVLDRIP